MIIFDVILLLILTVFATWGFFSGFIEAAGSLIGLIFATAIAGKYYLPISLWVGSFLSFGDKTIKVITFILIFIFVSKLVGFIFWIGEKLFNIISIIPFLKTINRLLGAILGLIEGVFVAGAFIYIINKFPINSWFETSLLTSKLSPILLKVFDPLIGFLPEILRQIKSLI